MWRKDGTLRHPSVYSADILLCPYTAFPPRGETRTSLGRSRVDTSLLTLGISFHANLGILPIVRNIVFQQVRSRFLLGRECGLLPERGRTRIIQACSVPPDRFFDGIPAIMPILLVGWIQMVMERPRHVECHVEESSPYLTNASGERQIV